MAATNTMRKVSLRNILAHKLRLALTVLAVVLGTSFIAGSFMFTNSLSATFDSAVSNAFTGVDAAVNGKNFDEAYRQKLADDPKVKGANLRSSQTVVVADKDAQPFQTGSGSATLSPYYGPEDTVGQPGELTSGKAPHGKGEVVINDTAAEKYGIEVGDELIVVHPQTRDHVTVSGIVTLAVSQGDALVLEMDAPGFVELYGKTSQMAVSAAEGVDADELVEHLNATYKDIEAESGEALAEELSDAIGSALKFVNYFLIAFGLIALLVGTFIIANTFSMIVAQRTKEFALLRALGASKSQISRSVVLEALVVGLIGSAVGVVAGVGLVAVIKAIMAGRGMEMGSSLGLSPLAVGVPIVLGTLVTVVSAWAPARRAGAVEPVEAMRSTEQAAGSSLVARTVCGLVAIAAGIAAALVGVYGVERTGVAASLVGVGAFAIIVGFFLAGPALSLPVVPTLGKIIGWPFGAVGALAATNSRRNPRRTAATAFALTLGVALVTAIGMLGETMKASVADTVDSTLTADYMLSGPTNGNFPTPEETPDLVADAPGVAEVVSLSTAPVTVGGEAGMNYGPQAQVSMVFDKAPGAMVAFDMREGTAEFSQGVIISESFADKHGWKLGQTQPLELAGTKVGEVEVKGIFANNDVVQNLAVVSDKIPEEARTIYMVGVNGEEGVDQEQLRADLEKAVKELLVVQVMSAQDFAGQAASMINQMLAILYGLLSLAVIIAVLGIVNTLTLGVIERRQEIGMLRAVGTARRQIRTMITLEAVQIAIFGALAGVLIGFGLGWAFIEVLGDSGLESAAVPGGLIAAMLGGSALVGVVAALWPAARAAKTPPLDAIAD
ncbi:ABC transporter permease [Corynebacterium lizhenjunii]|uniref:ABC transporter permease n=1 Tax=Corynebacterium lizhenjunii TaxID=2709394 RepID=UPI0013EABB04|nr:FtsX-like permease family protein [Corynebacterium lizhenjunii]